MMRHRFDIPRGIAVAGLAISVASCGRAPEPSTPAAPVRQVASGTITASPNPIKVCEADGLGTTTVSWTSPEGTVVEVRVGSPEGTLFAKRSGPGSQATGRWVMDGTTFYLVEIGPDDRPVGTIATVKVGVTKEGCR